jgi:cell division protein FtsB
MTTRRPDETEVIESATKNHPSTHCKEWIFNRVVTKEMVKWVSGIALTLGVLSVGYISTIQGSVVKQNEEIVAIKSNYSSLSEQVKELKGDMKDMKTTIGEVKGISSEALEILRKIK